jgi:hypothetical protein
VPKAERGFILNHSKKKHWKWQQYEIVSKESSSSIYCARSMLNCCQCYQVSDSGFRIIFAGDFIVESINPEIVEVTHDLPPAALPPISSKILGLQA